MTHTCTNCTLDLPLLLSKKNLPKLNITDIHDSYQTARYPGLTRTFTGSDSSGPSVHMFQCCRCDRLFSTQKAVKTHFSNLTKNDKSAPLLFTGKSAAERPGARRPGRDSESALAAGRAREKDCYFHKGFYNLSGPGPGYMIVKLGLAAADGPGACCQAGTGQGQGQLAGGAASLLRIEESYRFGFRVQVRAADGSGSA